MYEQLSALVSYVVFSKLDRMHGTVGHIAFRNQLLQRGIQAVQCGSRLLENAGPGWRIHVWILLRMGIFQPFYVSLPEGSCYGRYVVIQPPQLVHDFVKSTAAYLLLRAT